MEWRGSMAWRRISVWCYPSGKLRLSELFRPPPIRPMEWTVRGNGPDRLPSRDYLISTRREHGRQTTRGRENDDDDVDLRPAKEMTRRFNYRWHCKTQVAENEVAEESGRVKLSKDAPLAKCWLGNRIWWFQLSFYVNTVHWVLSRDIIGRIQFAKAAPWNWFL